MVNQYKLVLENADEPLDKEPDLRTHAEGGNIVRVSDKAFVEAPGDNLSDSLTIMKYLPL